jgi:hypothetical protein
MTAALPISWKDQSQFYLLLLVLLGVAYVGTGYLLRSVTPGGKLSWRGRLWQRGFTSVLGLFFGGLVISSLSAALFRWVTWILWGLLGWLAIILFRWLWRDREKGKAAQEGLIEKLHQEGRKLVAPPMSAGKKFWRWVLNGYAIALLLALVYGLVRYLVGSH